MPLQFWLRLTAALAVVGLTGWALFTVNSWRVAALELPEALKARDEAVAEMVAHRDSARKAAAVAAESEVIIEELQRAKTVTRVVYREAVRDDPTCAAWAAAPVGCPLGGVRIAEND